MYRTLFAAVLGLSLVGLPALTGCDRTVEEKHTVEQKKDGTTVQKDSKTTQQPDGTVVEKKSESVNK